MITLIARWTVKNGELEKVSKLLDIMVKETRQEPGCLRYEVFKSHENPNIILLHEEYRSLQAVQAHKDAPYFQHYVVNEIRPLLAERSSQLLSAIENP